uniref:Uncharacterized protein n=1 Tax=Desulfobacca acetoxidans TaxID=60893 RepID=A0A7V4G885_9BACT
MSRYMQLKVTVMPYYPRYLEETYPKTARYVKRSGSALPEPNPSLYDLAGQVDKLLYKLDGTPFREVLLRHREKLRTLHRHITEHIAEWRLAQADRLLYELEDEFDLLEAELD